jgi:hypothetical protein
MKLYITFGPYHVHSIHGHTFDENCIAVVEGLDLSECRMITAGYFGDDFAVLHPGMPPNPTNYKRGMIVVNEPPVLGRPRELDDPQRKQILLDPKDIQVAKLLGHGNVSAGIRKALAQACLCDHDKVS